MTPPRRIGSENRKCGGKWYGAFSVSPSDEAQVTAYIARQEEHHQTATFQDEYRELLKRHGIEFDERYVWD